MLAFGRRGLAERPECSNIASPVGLAQYLAIAAEVAAWVGQGRVLDWGAGWGQTSLLLRAHGVRVVAYDVEDKGAAAGLLRNAEVPYVVSPGPSLPFADRAFDAVLNCGVLEHVDDEPRGPGRAPTRPPTRRPALHVPPPEPPRVHRVDRAPARADFTTSGRTPGAKRATCSSARGFVSSAAAPSTCSRATCGEGCRGACRWRPGPAAPTIASTPPSRGSRESGAWRPPGP